MAAIRSGFEPMLKDLGHRLGAGFVAAVMIAVAAGITLVAAAFGAYAGLKAMVSPAAASAVTALIFAAVAAMIAVLAPRLIAGRRAARGQHLVQAHRPVDPALLKTGAEVGVALLGVVADLALSHRLKRQQKAREDKRRKHR